MSSPLSSLRPDEQAIALQLDELRRTTGSHTPSLPLLADRFPDMEIKHDVCFLHNPYAAELFHQHMQADLIKGKALEHVLAHYPSENPVLGRIMEETLGLPTGRVFLGNGAAEVIQAVMQTFVKRKVLICTPTFSSYYEFAVEGVERCFYPLQKDNDFALDVEDYLKTVAAEKPDAVVLINPNNPDGGYLEPQAIRDLLDNLSHIETVMVDESFIHFAPETEDGTSPSLEPLVADHPNLVVIKSLSKDFGIAGIRLGYGVMAPARVERILKTGYLWNINGIAEYFVRLFGRPDFQTEYEAVRDRYRHECQFFFKTLREVPNLKIYPSQANFALVEPTNDVTVDTLWSILLIRHGIYARHCGNKLGLEDGNFLRIAVPRRRYAGGIVAALKNVLG